MGQAGGKFFPSRFFYAIKCLRNKSKIACFKGFEPFFECKNKFARFWHARCISLINYFRLTAGEQK
ncbi:MAG: hypothetical protein COV66_08710 [Nitrospinae bacterium CG11_big_fil_rev_8_21_14_0_20_45_15]|nr:MAG: hypothetical protein COV66_08710 [Nitrospinae bacterium CG11_big_fil_rev_8_21_14_0_20_45_15]